MVYNSYDKIETPINDTSVTARLTFKVRVGEYNAEYMNGLSQDDMVPTVFYQRIVDIKKN